MRKRTPTHLKVLRQMRELVLPQAPPAFPNWDIHWDCLPVNPHEGVTGDFLDVVSLRDGRLHFSIGDVSGKGLNAARISLMAWHMWRGFVAIDPQPSAVLEKLNTALPEYVEEDHFLTMMCGCIEPTSGRVVYARAGHTLPMLLQASGSIELLPGNGSPLCVQANQRFDPFEVKLNRGDTLFLYTDGISELRRGSEMIGTEGLQQWIAPELPTRPRELITTIVKKAYNWTEERFHDDIALLAIQREG